jgi:HAE1 family hydrophobic/amphiphilic exporter-1
MNQLLTYQPLDVLTMLGFIILVGIVVNNAILIVDQTLRGLREDGLDTRSAVREAVAMRVRPIFMSTFTSVFGMLPLVVFPGAGSELYRGLGSVVLGGLLVATMFTLFLIPSLLSLVLDARQGLSRLLKREFQP